LASRNEQKAMLEEDYEPEVALDDEQAVETLAPFYDARPARQAWRSDPESAPIAKPVYARAPDSIRVLIAIRDEEGWVSVRRDGELRRLESVGFWAPLSAAIA
jgi:hypothetical protein